MHIATKTSRAEKAEFHAKVPALQRESQKSERVHSNRSAKTLSWQCVPKWRLERTFRKSISIVSLVFVGIYFHSVLK